VDAITPGFGADIDYRIAHTLGPGKKEFVLFSQPDTADIDQRILGVAGVKINLATDSRDAKSIAVARNTTYHTFCNRPVFRFVEWSKAQRIQDSYRPGAHGENITQNAAHTSGRTLIGLDIRGVVM